MKTEQYEEFLKKQGLRLTRERLQLLEGVQAQNGHFTIEALLYNLRKDNYRVSRDTVYRNLSHLIEAGVIRQSFRTARETVYEVATGKGHHDHLMCRKCGKVIEFMNEEIEDLQKNIAKKFHFKLESHCHQLVGLCQECAHD